MTSDTMKKLENQEASTESLSFTYCLYELGSGCHPKTMLKCQRSWKLDFKSKPQNKITSSQLAFYKNKNKNDKPRRERWLLPNCHLQNAHINASN